MPLLDFILHIDQHLIEFVANYGTWIYAILFMIIFVETGLVVMPFLPGDSLLFAAGGLAAQGAMDPVLLIILLVIAAVLGDNINYGVGRLIGPRVFEIESRWINKDYIKKAHLFFEKHGGKTVIFARFIPFARTFVPFVAGASQMPYKQYLLFSMIGGICWITAFTTVGYFFANAPIIKENFTLFIFGIIFITILPGIFAFIRDKISKCA